MVERKIIALMEALRESTRKAAMTLTPAQTEAMRAAWTTHQRAAWRDLAKAGDPVVEPMTGGPLDGLKRAVASASEKGDVVAQSTQTELGAVVASYRFDGERWVFEEVYRPGRGG